MGETRIQLCGPLVAKVDGERIEHGLPGRQGRLLFAYLVTTRRRPATWDELLDVIWDDALPSAPDAALSALVSKMRRIGESEVATAERAARRLVELEPLNETGARLLMHVHERRGNRAGALLAYDALRMRLRDELGVSPSPEVQELHRRLLG